MRNGNLARTKHRNATSSVTGILHAGAVTRFDQTVEVARLNNITGTTNVLAYGRQCPRLERIGIVSTAFVAGRRGGTIREDELDVNADFNNEYERSKAHAEYQVRLAMQELPSRHLPPLHRRGQAHGRIHLTTLGDLPNFPPFL